MAACLSCGASMTRHHLARYCFPCIKGGQTPATHPSKQAARAKVQRAIEKGVLPKLDGSVACVDCGKPARDYDHRDYSKPLDVAPVCRSCNLRRGTALCPEMEAA